MSDLATEKRYLYYPFRLTPLDIPTMSHNSASTSQIVTIPYIAELFNPSFLDVLLPIKGVKTVDESMQVDVPKNAMMAALQTTTHQALTENGAMTYDSTGSPLLDAFQGITRDTYGRKVDTYLDAAWKEDADMTLKLIWSLRSIHDGKGEKEVFYRYVPLNRLLEMS